LINESRLTVSDSDTLDFCLTSAARVRFNAPQESVRSSVSKLSSSFEDELVCGLTDSQLDLGSILDFLVGGSLIIETGLTLKESQRVILE